MGNRIFVGVVVVLWAGTMSWLMVARILPPFFHGEPPTHGALRARRTYLLGNPFNGGAVGHAVSQAVRRRAARRKSTAASCLRTSSERTGAAVDGRPRARALGEVSLDIRSAFVLDSLNNLSYFHTRRCASMTCRW